MAGLPNGILGTLALSSFANAIRIASLGVVPFFSQYAVSGSASEPRRNVTRSFIEPPDGVGFPALR
jgi:hypothetical protein